MIEYCDVKFTINSSGRVIVHLKLVSHISARVDISVSKTVQMISVQRGWGPREMVWCQNETNLDVVG